MVSDKVKHQYAFCASAISLLVGLSLVAVAFMINSAVTPIILVAGGVLTFLSALQTIESYSFLQNSEKPVSKVKNYLPGKPESKLFIERIFEPFVEVFGKNKRAD